VIDLETNPAEALFHAAEGDDYDSLIFRSISRRAPAVQSGALAGAHAARANPGDCRPENNTRLSRGLETHVNDYFLRPVDKNELLARARAQIRKTPLHRPSARQCADGDHGCADGLA
jgi:two-component system cell cycle response regulator